MSRAAVIRDIERYFDDGIFVSDLARRVAIPTESQNPARGAELLAYLDDEMRASLERMGLSCSVLANTVAGGSPFLLAERVEDATLTTVFTYGHGDVIRGQEKQWRAGLDPWLLTRE